ncbi:single-stranded DNA-binding protein [Candidatus Marinimicrobia bacterium]|nr:single-stranded DNA-binding protein [Candidatus Neomarinimicrobiota bacterium]
MNNCVFLGRIADDLQISEEFNTKVLRFKMSIDKYRKNKNGQKIRDRNFLFFEAWDTGAQTIYDHCEAGDSLVVNCTARSGNGKVTFRVNEFKIVNNLQTSTDEEYRE